MRFRIPGKIQVTVTDRQLRPTVFTEQNLPDVCVELLSGLHSDYRSRHLLTLTFKQKIYIFISLNFHRSFIHNLLSHVF